MSSEKWKTVDLGAGTPRLLMKTRFDSAGYLVQLTDLGRVWEEVADRDAIVRQARNGECSFDPGADEDNYAALLKYIENALNGEPKTSISLHAGESGQLELDLTASLPGDLPVLKWKLCLARLPDSALAVELVNPLLLQVNSLHSQIQQLVAEISAKDHVISKITDKFETSGNDLTAVFPGASNVKMSRKKSQRSQLAGHVKGLADFDAATWKASIGEANGASGLTDKQLDSLLHQLSPSDAIRPPDEDWWADLDGSTSSQRGAIGSSKAIAASRLDEKPQQPQSSNLVPQDSMQDDEFERQRTPPQITTRAGSSKADAGGSSMNSDVKHQDHAANSAVNNDDDETEDDDDLDGPYARNETHVQDRLRQHERFTVPSIEKDDLPSTTVSPRKLGVIGGKKALTPHPQPQPPATTDEPEPEPSPAQRKSKLGTFGGKTKSKDATPEPINKPKPKLGAFGGRAKASTASTPEVQSEQRQTSETRAIGKAGGRSVTGTASPVKTEPKAETVVEAEKSEEQRANENRERLKRELEEKAKQPVKKKRKF